ncbi:cytosolic carboxypeptidase 1 isoform X3, partial [Ixodes scapularis]
LCPLLYSVRDACLRGAGWRRVGERICYFRNQYVRRGHEGPFHTLSFCLHFPHRGDVCYLACAFPYTFSLLKAHLHCWMHSHDASSIFFQRQELCKTTSGNPVPVLTLTAKPLEVSRPHVFLSARVHPGETNSSWIMKGLVDFLLSSKPLAQRLRQTYVFKLVPMLNPDGVINGCHRCSLEGQDLNRQWSYPDALMHPTVFHSKALIRYLASVSHTPLTAHCLDCLAWATRSKRNVLQVVQHGDAQPLLLLLSPGPGCPVPNGNHREKLLVRTLRANLQCLLNIANCKTGRRWLSDGGTPTLLWRWCSTLPEGAPWERLVALACVVIQRCLPPFRLPVASLDGPIAWPPPEWANRAGAHRARDDAVPGDGPGSLMAMDAEESSQSATSSSSEHEADSENEQLDDMQSHAVLSGNETDLDLLEYARFFPELQPQNGCMGVLSEVSKIREGSAESGTVTSRSPDDSLDGQEPAGWQEEQYRRVAQSTQGVVPLVKLAHPELKGHNHCSDLEPLNPDNNMHARAKLLEHVGVQLGMKVVTSRVAYDYDELVTHQLPPERPLGNDDEARAALGRVCVPLRFESRFESGNLRKAIQVGEFEYDLIMSPDVSTNFHHRWFYFEVAGMCEDVDYTFNIINFERSFSLYME